MGHYAADMRPEWFEMPKSGAKSEAEYLKASDLVDREVRYTANMLKEVEQLNAAVDAFAARMKARLEQKAKQGFAGWDKASPDLLRSLLLDSVTKESTLDLGIYAMMLAHRGISMKVSSNEN